MIYNDDSDYNVYWYNWYEMSFGFAPNSRIALDSADTEEPLSDDRLSWHMQAVNGGWRAGSHTGLNRDDDWMKVVYYKKCEDTTTAQPATMIPTTHTPTSAYPTTEPTTQEPTMQSTDYDHECEYELVVNEDFKFWEAELYCQIVYPQNGHLMSIHDRFENKLAQELCNNDDINDYNETNSSNCCCWIGLSDETTESVYKWTDNSDYGDYQNWNDNEGPKSSLNGVHTEDCAVITDYNGEWYDRDCDFTENIGGFICQFGCNKAPTKGPTVQPTTGTTTTNSTATTPSPINAFGTTTYSPTPDPADITTTKVPTAILVITTNEPTTILATTTNEPTLPPTTSICGDGIRNGRQFDFVVLYDNSCGLSEESCEAFLDGIGKIVETLMNNELDSVAVVEFTESQDTVVVVDFDDPLQNDVTAYVEYIKSFGECTDGGNGTTDLLSGIEQAYVRFDPNNGHEQKIIIVSACEDVQTDEDCDTIKPILDHSGKDVYAINIVNGAKQSPNYIKGSRAYHYLSCLSDDNICMADGGNGIDSDDFDYIIDWCLVDQLCPYTQEPTTTTSSTTIQPTVVEPPTIVGPTTATPTTDEPTTADPTPNPTTSTPTTANPTTNEPTPNPTTLTPTTDEPTTTTTETPTFSPSTALPTLSPTTEICRSGLRNGQSFDFVVLYDNSCGLIGDNCDGFLNGIDMIVSTLLNNELDRVSVVEFGSFIGESKVMSSWDSLYNVSDSECDEFASDNGETDLLSAIDIAYQLFDFDNGNGYKMIIVSACEDARLEETCGNVVNIMDRQGIDVFAVNIPNAQKSADNHIARSRAYSYLDCLTDGNVCVGDGDDGVGEGDFNYIIDWCLVNQICPPTQYPTMEPTPPTDAPTYMPTSPTSNPTTNPSPEPTLNPTQKPSFSPTLNPTTKPSTNPTLNPTTAQPTFNPSQQPTTNPTDRPSRPPTEIDETHAPTDEPTTHEPTTTTTDSPTTDSPTTDEPTTDEPTTDDPTTFEPSSAPTEIPTTLQPILSPTSQPVELSTTNEPTIERETTLQPTLSPTTIVCGDGQRSNNNKSFDFVILYDNSCGLSDDNCQLFLHGIADLASTLMNNDMDSVALIEFGEDSDDMKVLVDFDDYELQNDINKMVNYISMNGECVNGGNGNTDLITAIAKSQELFSNYDSDGMDKIVIVSTCEDSRVDQSCSQIQIPLQFFDIDVYAINIAQAQTQSSNHIKRSNAWSYLSCLTDDNICMADGDDGISNGDFMYAIDDCLVDGFVVGFNVGLNDGF